MKQIVSSDMEASAAVCSSLLCLVFRENSVKKVKSSKNVGTNDRTTDTFQAKSLYSRSLYQKVASVDSVCFLFKGTLYRTRILECYHVVRTLNCLVWELTGYVHRDLPSLIQTVDEKERSCNAAPRIC
ncbi:hypothetical protein CRM22_010423 [Opisthorchis felineus]|uniref:Uncharacterized protein n=1 Tax=Opisthorchis felineus TaxID=147828 RepID=A0A4S2L3X9_OPIFE|nr:hypothetical protein CRM22_010423 [Opisthorchis felineus]